MHGPCTLPCTDLSAGFPQYILRLFDRPSTHSITCSARTWMVQVAYRQAVARRSYLMKRSFYSGTNLSSLENAMQEECNVAESVAAQLTGAQLLEALETLNDKQQTTLRLRFFDGCDLREIAERLGESFENIRHYYYRGLDRLRKEAVERGLESKRKAD